MPMFKRRFLGLLLILASGCGGNSSPAAPSPANVAGTWLGTMQYTAMPIGGGTLTQFEQPISISLTQSGTAVSGTWTTTNGHARNGAVGGTTTTTSFSGSLTYNTTSTTGGQCTGTIAVSGSAGGNSLTWTSPIIIENCTDPLTNITITAVRQ
jgi:hypothetical protein